MARSARDDRVAGRLATVDGVPRRASKARGIGMAVGVALAATVTGADAANAGTYVLRSCNVPGYATVSTGVWQPRLTPNANGFDWCSAGRGFGFSLQPALDMAWLSRAYFILDLSGEKQRDEIEFQRVRIWAVSNRTSAGSRLYRVAAAMLDDGSIRNLSVVNPFGVDALTNPIDVSPARDTVGMMIGLWCGGVDDAVALGKAAAAPNCIPGDGASIEIHGVEVTLSEDVLPTGTIVGGSLLDRTQPGPIRTLSYAASDRESGLAKVEILLGDTIVASRDLSGACDYAGVAACPRHASDTVAVDTRQVQGGPSPVILRIIDAAGNRQIVQGPVVEVDSGSASTPAAPIASGPVRLSARFATSPRSTLIAPFGRRIRIRGTLQSASGSRLGKVRIDAFEQAARPGARESQIGSTSTREDGTFSYVLAAKRPSRNVRLRFGASGNQAVASSRVLRLRVRSSAQVRASLRGTRISFAGRVLAHPLPPTGKLVTLQGRARGYQWASFAKVRTDRYGRFTGSYRLPVRRPGVTLEIRANLPAERGHPYLSYSSRSVVIRVR